MARTSLEGTIANLQQDIMLAFADVNVEDWVEMPPPCELPHITAGSMQVYLSLVAASEFDRILVVCFGYHEGRLVPGSTKNCATGAKENFAGSFRSGAGGGGRGGLSATSPPPPATFGDR